MDYLKTADEIVDVYFVTYIESCDKNNNSHSTSWRNRYIGQDGVIYILKNGNRQFFVWHPVDDDFKPITSLGIISSRDDYYIKKNNLLVTGSLTPPSLKNLSKRCKRLIFLSIS